MAEKINLEDDNENDIFHDDDLDQHLSSRRTEKTDLQNHWETMLEENEPGLVDPYNKMASSGTYILSKLLNFHDWCFACQC